MWSGTPLSSNQEETRQHVPQARDKQIQKSFPHLSLSEQQRFQQTGIFTMRSYAKTAELF